MAKHARPRPRRIAALRAPLLARSSKTLLVAAVSGGLLAAGGIGAADVQPPAAADELVAAHPSGPAVGLVRVVPAALDQSRHEVAALAAHTAYAAEAERIIAAVQAAKDRRVAAVTAAAKARAEAAKAAEASRRAEAARKARASRSTARVAPLPSGFGARVLAIAARYAGVPYVYGGASPSGFDCSGFVGYVFRQVGVSLPRTAAQIRAATERITRSQLRPGDLVFVHKASGVSHVAIYAGANMWWEANRPGRPVGKHAAWTTSVSYGRVG